MTKDKAPLDLTGFNAILSDVAAGPIGVAVSGGGDSVALLSLMAAWAKNHARELYVATVNHNLRADAAAEAESVGRLCKIIGLHHDVLSWDDWDKHGNLQDAARIARKTLLADWARMRGIETITLGHTHDDQAETVLMRLARGSGVDGLAGMYPHKRDIGLVWVRPMLNLRRAELREHLRGRGISWVEDPSNDDNSFDRVKARKALDHLRELGLTPDRLVLTADNMKRARAQLEQDCLDFARKCALPTPIGSVHLRPDRFAKAHPELRLRLLSHCLRWVSAASYAPRLDATKRAESELAAGKSTSLHGCLISQHKDGRVEITREFNAMPTDIASTLAYDNRWAIAGLDRQTPYQLRGLGDDGIALCPDWAQTGHSRRAIVASPSVWLKGELIAAPFAGKQNSCTCALIRGHHHFFTSIKTH